MECPLVHCILSFESTSYKRIQDAASLPVPLFLVVLHRIIIYISRYHFYNFLEPNSTFTEKKIFVTNFHFLTDSPKPSAPLTAKFTKRDKSFLLMLPKFGKFLV